MAYPDKTIKRALELSKNRSAEKARRMLEKELLSQKTPDGVPINTENDIPSARTINRWKGNSPLQKKPAIKQKHFHGFTDIVKELLSDDLDSVKRNKKGKFEYVSREYYPPLLHTETVTKKELIESLKQKLEYAQQLYQKLDMLDHFEKILIAENPQIKSIKSYIETSPFEFIQILKEYIWDEETKKTTPSY